ncbi:hypothetical protein BH11BAC3_BH11BAC3_44920 [soil metagenome]
MLAQLNLIDMRKKILIALLFFSSTAVFAQREMFPPNLLPNTTIRIIGYTDTTINGIKHRNISVGTSFFYEFDIDSFKVMTLVTNKHVIEKSKEGILSIKLKDTLYKLGNKQKSETITLSNFNKQWIIHPHEDLAILPMNRILNTTKQKAKTDLLYSWFTIGNIPTIKDSLQISSVEKVVMVGYPKSLWDSTNNLPTIRQGLTATPYFSDFNGQKRFLLDIPTFSGSSGSPVLLYSFDPYWTSMYELMNEFRSYLLGITVESYNYDMEGTITLKIPNPLQVDSLEKNYRSQINLPLNIGVVIKASELEEFTPLIKAFLNSNKNYPIRN